jgi:hypothetical protein
LKTTIQLPPKKPDYSASHEQIKTLRSFENFSCVAEDSLLIKKLGKKQASEIIKRLKEGEVIELKG